MQVRSKLLKWVLIYLVAIFAYGYASSCAQEASHGSMHNAVTSCAIFTKNVFIDNFAMDINNHCSILKRSYLFRSKRVWPVYCKSIDSLGSNCSFCYSHIRSFFWKSGLKRVFFNTNTPPMCQINCRSGATIFNINSSYWSYFWIDNVCTGRFVFWYLNCYKFRWIHDIIYNYITNQDPRPQLVFSYIFKYCDIFNGSVSAYLHRTSNLFHCSGRTIRLINRIKHAFGLFLGGFPKPVCGYPQPPCKESKESRKNSNEPIGGVRQKVIVPLMILFSVGMGFLVMWLGDLLWKRGFERFATIFVFIGLFTAVFGWLLVILLCAYRDGRL